MFYSNFVPCTILSVENCDEFQTERIYLSRIVCDIGSIVYDI